MKWAMELSEFDISYKPRASIKGHALADVMVEFGEAQDTVMDVEPSDPSAWNLFVDESSDDTSSRAKIILINPEGYKLNYAIRFGLQAQTMRQNTRHYSLASAFKGNTSEKTAH